MSARLVTCQYNQRPHELDDECVAVSPVLAIPAEFPLALQQTLARLDSATRMLPRDMQQDVFELAEEAYRIGVRQPAEGVAVRATEYGSAHEFTDPGLPPLMDTGTNRGLSERRVAYWTGAGVPSRLVERLVWVGPRQDAT